jgi:integrase
MPLTDAAIRRSKPKQGMYRMPDERGLSLQIEPNGTRAWRFRYRFSGREKMISLGLYPDVSLADARKRRDDARRDVASSRDPSKVRTAERLAAITTFEGVAREWYATHEPTWAPSHSAKVLLRLENDVFPWIGKLPIDAVTSAEILECLKRVASRGAADTARRIRQCCGAILRYAVSTSRATRDVAADLRDAIAAPIGGRYRSITDSKRLGRLMLAIDAYEGTFIVRCALALAPHVFVRPGELRAAEWSEFDLHKKLWSIPATRRKLSKRLKAHGQPHLVPLSAQAVAILRDLKPATEKGAFVFPGELDNEQPMSDGTLNKALRKIGFGGELVAHGLRHTASTLLHEQGFQTEWIERQLSHADSNAIRGVYNHAKYLRERVRMMQAWSDFLDETRADAIEEQQRSARGSSCS